MEANGYHQLLGEPSVSIKDKHTALSTFIFYASHLIILLKLYVFMYLSSLELGPIYSPVLKLRIKSKYNVSLRLLLTKKSQSQNPLVTLLTSLSAQISLDSLHYASEQRLNSELNLFSDKH